MRVIIPYPPGAVGDIMMRTVGEIKSSIFWDIPSHMDFIGPILFKMNGAAITVATMGAEGAECLSSIDPTTAPMPVSDRSGDASGASPGGVRWRVRANAYPAEVVSSLGAGDVYHGALLAALVRGRSLADAMRYAAVAAAMSCAGLDGRSAIPYWDDVAPRAADVDVRTERVTSTTPIEVVRT